MLDQLHSYISSTISELQGVPEKTLLKIFWTRDHALHLLADIVVRTPQQLHEMGHSAGVHHSLQDYYVCEQVKSMISSPKIL